MSEHMPELAGAEAAAPQASEAVATSQVASHLDARAADAPSIAPDHEAPKPDEPVVEAPKAEAAKPDPADIEIPRIVVPRFEAAKPEDKPGPEVRAERKFEPKPGKLIVMPPSERIRDHQEPGSDTTANEEAAGGKRRLSAMAAVIALAAVVGALSGALATTGVMHFAANQAPAPAPVPVAAPNTSALEASLARIDGDLAALKANLDHTAKAGVSQFNKTNDRLEKLEKAQAEPMARLAKLSDAVEKLRAAPAAAPVQSAAAKETTGSISPTQVATAAAAPPPAAAAPKTEVGRLPTVEGWRIRDIANGGALIEGRTGIYEVYAGDPVPGLGRVDAIRRQDGRWVVVTTRGLIVAR